MAADPSFASTPYLGIITLSTANTSPSSVNGGRDGGGTITAVSAGVTSAAPAAGRLITQITVQATVDPADGIVTIFLSDGTTHYLFDEIDHDNPAAATTTVAAYRTTRTYTNLVLPSGWSVRAACTATPTAGQYNIFVHGADL